MLIQENEQQQHHRKSKPQDVPFLLPDILFADSPLLPAGLIFPLIGNLAFAAPRLQGGAVYAKFPVFPDFIKADGVAQFLLIVQIQQQFEILLGGLHALFQGVVLLARGLAGRNLSRAGVINGKRGKQILFFLLRQVVFTP